MSFFFFTLSAPQIFFKDEKDKSLSIEFKLYWTQDILLHALEEWEEADCTATPIFLFLESLLLRNWVWLCASVLADMSNLFVCILACASSCPLMHCIYCFACDMSVVPLSSSKMMPRSGMQIPPRLPRATPNSAIPQNPVAIGGQQMPQVWVLGLSTATQWVRTSVALH